ncbi:MULTISPECIES: effector-associated constant component EACC1 [unclassified Streptomyces]|uniref:effector-associated constant component EACC1 n=1 Tax=unclassified Streptomyces TaxID=2593676 RepID=UPI003701E0C5
MSVRIDVVGDDDALEELWDWLSDERALRGRMRLQSAPPAPGTMGSGLEIAVDLSNLGMSFVATLTSVIGTWLTHRGRTRRSGGTVVVTGPDGTRYEISHPDADELRRLTEALTRLHDRDDDPAA